VLADYPVMDLEITIDQARLLGRLRRRYPDADVRVHSRSWGAIVEVRRAGHVVGLTALKADGSIAPDRPLTRAA
jgi:hypothetical protein